MTNEEMTIIHKALEENFLDAFDITYDPLDSTSARNHKQNTVAIVATLVDYLRGNIEGLPSPITALASQAASSSQPSAPADNGDPDSLATEVMKKLGSLGLQSLTELKGYKIDDNNHILLHINGRMADTGWTEERPLSVLARIMREQELLLPRLP